MREIEFRGKTLNGDWVYGLLAHCKKKTTTVDVGWYISNKSGMPFAYQVIQETIGQWTGMKDCNGKKIYDGDIVSADENEIAMVLWDDDRYMFIVSYNSYDNELSEYYSKDLEVIGNYTDNQALLGGDDE